MSYKLRLGSTLEFDNREQDLMLVIKQLTDQHKLGQYINALLRYVWENPEQFKDTDIDPLKYGISDRRAAFFNDVNGRVKKCQDAINGMYREMIALSTAAKVGATFGLVENTSDFLMGLECIENYTEKIKQILNTSGLSAYESANKTKSKAEEIANSAAEILVKMMVAKRIDLRIDQQKSQQTAVSEVHMARDVPQEPQASAQPVVAGAAPVKPVAAPVQTPATPVVQENKQTETKDDVVSDDISALESFLGM